MNAEEQFRVISELQRYGWTLRRIGILCDVGKSTVERWKAGVAEPTYTEWTKVLKAHSTVICPTFGTSTAI